MKISIVIPAYNESAHLSESLPAIHEAALIFKKLDWSYELIVCDNNSSDNTSEIAKSFGCSVVFEPINQIARARNSGAKAATGEWLIFIDAGSGCALVYGIGPVLFFVWLQDPSSFVSETLLWNSTALVRICLLLKRSISALASKN